MLAVEQSLLDTGQDSGRAMIFASYATMTQNGQQGQDPAAG